MRRLRVLILIFVMALAVPMGYLVHRTQLSMEQEETAELRFFANTLFNQMEQELAALVQREEQRPVDEYMISPPTAGDGSREGESSPLAHGGVEPYILGYLQNNPDGSFTTPLAEGGGELPPDRAAVVKRLEDVNRIFNSMRTVQPEVPDRLAAATTRKKSGVEEKEPAANKKDESSFAGKYLDFSKSRKQKDYLGQAEKRVEQISPQQALNLAQRNDRQEAALGRNKSASSSKQERGGEAGQVQEAGLPAPSSTRAAASELPRRPGTAGTAVQLSPGDGLRVEIDPLQSVHIDQDQVLMFRRIVAGNQVYRQGMVIQVEEFLKQVMDRHFSGQPMARFASLTLTSMNGGREVTRVREGREIVNPRFSLDRDFPRPFSFVRANLACETIPRSPGRLTLNVMTAVTAGVLLLGLLAIYQSARVVTELSERRGVFVSSVTHELKTPLTNIRMYIEMLEQGIATSPEREFEYYRILESESARLSRLINNVLEFSKLEKRQRQLNLGEGSLEEVLGEVRDAMREWLHKEGFTLTVENLLDRPFRYDREVMVQVLMNLIENSVKFGRSASRREIAVRARSEGDRVVIRVSDTGPGIPRHALKKIFDDFYRVDDELTRTTKGTGIGLALVKRFVEAMGGRVSAANNDGAGCTITITLPKERRPS
ncbi:MAG: HAMP domain-containing sensor histidine kinase [Syntrophobacter sp.]